MDPDATARLIAEALRRHDHESARSAAKDLREWLERGGFEPRWQKWPEAWRYFRRSLRKR